jgi:hypothetical protein
VGVMYPRRLLETCLLQALFVLYVNEKEAMYGLMIYEKKKTPENRKRKILQKKPLPLLCFQLCFLPLFCSLFCINSAATFSYYLVFPCHNLLPFEVCFAGKISQHIPVSRGLDMLLHAKHLYVKFM